MKSTYSPEADILYVQIAPGNIDYTEPVGSDDDRLVDYDPNDVPLGIEILDASMGINLDGLPRADLVLAAAKKFKLPISTPA